PGGSQGSRTTDRRSGGGRYRLGRLPSASRAGIVPLVTSAPPAPPPPALALSVGGQTAYPQPTVAAAAPRALGGCGRGPGPASLPTARTCCGVTAVTSGPAEVRGSQAAAPLGPTTALLAVVPRPAPVSVRATLVQPMGSGPPTFLEQRHLLL